MAKSVEELRNDISFYERQKRKGGLSSDEIREMTASDPLPFWGERRVTFPEGELIYQRYSVDGSRLPYWSYDFGLRVIGLDAFLANIRLSPSLIVVLAILVSITEESSMTEIIIVDDKPVSLSETERFV